MEQHCARYQRAKPMLEAGIEDTEQLLDVMKAIRFTSGETRTLWTATFDLSAREMDVRYRPEGFEVAHRERMRF